MCAAIAVALVAFAAGGCAARSAATGPAVPGGPGRPRVAVLPLENLSGHAEYGNRFSRLVWTSMGRTGRFDLVDPGEVDAMLVELRIRSAGALTRDQLLKASGRLGAPWIMAGTLLECGTVRTPDGDVPTFSIALRLIDARTGSVAWTDLRARSGEDRETVFGWGRETSLERLADATTRDLLQNLTIPQTPDSTRTEGTK
jgi:TolB-like protein